MSDKKRIIELQRSLKIARDALTKIRHGRSRCPEADAEEERLAEPCICQWQSRTEAAEAETARLRAALEAARAQRDERNHQLGEQFVRTFAAETNLAEAEARGRRQGLEEAAKWHDEWQVRNRDTGVQSRARLHGRYAASIRSLATTPTETQKPETEESQ